MEFATFQSPPQLPVAACVKLPSAACEGHGRRAHVSGHGPQRAARAERDYRGGEGGEGGGRRGVGAHLAALDEKKEDVVVAARRKARRASAHVMHAPTPPHTTRQARLTTGRAAQPETSAKGHSRFCDFSAATQASNGQTHLHSHSLPQESGGDMSDDMWMCESE